MRYLITALVVLLAACGGGGSDAATPPNEQAQQACKVLRVQLFGDSTFVGYTGTSSTPLAYGPAQMLQTAMDQRFGAGAVVVENRAVSGTTSVQLRAGTDGLNKPWPQSVDADITVMNHGINDLRLGVPLGTYRDDIAVMKPTIYATPSPTTKVAWSDNFYLANAPVVADVSAYVLALPDWQDYLVDGVHPSAELYQMISTNVIAPAVGAQVAALRCK